MKPVPQEQSVHQAENQADFLRLSFILACEYESVYIIQSADSSYVKYYPDRVTHTLMQCGSGEDFYEALGVFCAACAEQEDRDEVMQLLGSQNLADAMQRQRPFTVSTRFLVAGEPLYYNIKVFPCASQEMIVLGVRNADTQMLFLLYHIPLRFSMREAAFALTNQRFWSLPVSLYWKSGYENPRRFGCFDNAKKTLIFLLTKALFCGIIIRSLGV